MEFTTQWWWYKDLNANQGGRGQESYLLGLRGFQFQPCDFGFMKTCLELGVLVMLGVQENSLRIGCLRLLADDNQDVEVRSPEDDHRKKDKATRREEYDREASQPAHPSSRYPHDQIGIKLMMMIKSGNIPTSCTTRPFVPIDSREGGILLQVPNRKEGRLSSISISWEFEFLHHDRTLLQQQQQTAIGRAEEENRYLNHDRGVSLQHSC